MDLTNRFEHYFSPATIANTQELLDEVEIEMKFIWQTTNLTGNRFKGNSFAIENLFFSIWNVYAFEDARKVHSKRPFLCKKRRAESAGNSHKLPIVRKFCENGNRQQQRDVIAAVHHILWLQFEFWSPLTSRNRPGIHQLITTELPSGFLIRPVVRVAGPLGPSRDARRWVIKNCASRAGEIEIYIKATLKAITDASHVDTSSNQSTGNPPHLVLTTIAFRAIKHLWFHMIGNSYTPESMQQQASINNSEIVIAKHEFS